MNKIKNVNQKELDYWPYCHVCKAPFDFDRNEPFAHCNCGTTEWGSPRPASWIPDPNETSMDWKIEVMQLNGEITRVIANTAATAAALALTLAREKSHSEAPNYFPRVVISNRNCVDAFVLHGYFDREKGEGVDAYILNATSRFVPIRNDTQGYSLQSSMMIEAISSAKQRMRL